MNCLGKKVLVFLLPGVLLLRLIQLTAAPKVELLITPNPVRAGEEAYLVIRSNDGARNTPLSRRMPKVNGLRWLSGIQESSQVRIINGRRTAIYESRIPFTVDRPGSYTIPPMNLTHSRERTGKLTFEAVEARYRTSDEPKGKQTRDGKTEEGLTPEQLMFMELEIPGRKPFYYLGDEIPVEVNIYVLRGVRPQLSWPQIGFGEKAGAVFRDYRQVNPDNPNFAGVTQQETERDGRNYILYSFRTAIRPISAGKLELTAKENAALIVRDNRRSRASDPFFDDFFEDTFFARNRQIARNLNSIPLTLEVRSLPPVPEGVRYTGLSGTWESHITLSPPPYRVGETITLKVEFQGSGSTDTLRTWPLELPGFRVYPPEVEKNGGGAEIRYVLIPTEPYDGKEPNLRFGPFATFSNGKYQIHQFSRAVRIEKSQAVIPAGGPQYNTAETAGPAAAAATEPAKRKAEDILYLKKHEGRRIALPLSGNLGAGLLLILAGAVFFLIAAVVNQIRRMHRNDPDYQRKMNARRKKPELLSRLKKLSAEDFPGEYAGDIAAYIADAKGLPQGADLSECAAALKPGSPELARMLEDLSEAAWLPSAKNRFTPEFRKALIKALGRLAAAALLLWAPELSSAEAETIRSAEEAMNAYDTGKFEAAEKYYRAKLNPAEPSANYLYNLGNCLYKQGKLPQALVCFERALRLAPRDSDILENLNLVRRKLLLPERCRVDSPSDVLPYLRDSLRPDEWLLLVFAGAALLLTAGGVRLLTGGRKRLVRLLLAGGLLLIVLPGTAWISQQNTSYDPDHAVVKVRNLPVYSLPSDQAGKEEMSLRAGEEVAIAERRLDWVRIRTGKVEGWVHARDLAGLWQPDSLGEL